MLKRFYVDSSGILSWFDLKVALNGFYSDKLNRIWVANFESLHQVTLFVSVALPAEICCWLASLLIQTKRALSDLCLLSFYSIPELLSNNLYFSISGILKAGVADSLSLSVISIKLLFCLWGYPAIFKYGSDFSIDIFRFVRVFYDRQSFSFSFNRLLVVGNLCVLLLLSSILNSFVYDSEGWIDNLDFFGFTFFIGLLLFAYDFLEHIEFWFVF